MSAPNRNLACGIVAASLLAGCATLGGNVEGNFACRAPDQCTGWVAAPGSSAKRYAMRFDNGAWRFTADPRTIAE